MTTSGETLAWTLDQFKSGNLPDMIRRAGYPSIADLVDEKLLEEKMPEIEARSWELVALNKQAPANDGKKTKAQLIQELEALRQQVAAL